MNQAQRQEAATPPSQIAQAVLTVATKSLYGLDPEDVPVLVYEYRRVIAVAFRELAKRGELAEFFCASDACMEAADAIRTSFILAIAAELDGAK